MSIQDLEEFKGVLYEMKQTVASANSTLYAPLHMLKQYNPKLSESDLFEHSLTEIEEMEAKLQRLISLSKAIREKLLTRE